MAQLAALHGGPAPGEPDADIVRHLETALELAREGKIRAVAIVALQEPHVMRRWFKAQSPLGNALLGGVVRLERMIELELARDDA